MKVKVITKFIDPITELRRHDETGVFDGYKFDLVVCPECSRLVADNWMIRHLKSGCLIGISKADAFDRDEEIRTEYKL